MSMFPRIKAVPSRESLRRVPVWAIAFAALALAACGTPQPPHDAYGRWADTYPGQEAAPGQASSGQPSSSQAAPPEQAAPDAASASDAASAPAPQRQASLPPVQRPPAGATTGEPPPEPPKLEELRGLNAAQLTALLGKPTLLRDEPAAQMWQYRSESCVLHLFLYPAQGGEKRVQYAEARSRQIGAPATTTGPSECLATLVGAQRLRS
ncbi:MAG TPA: hypothetical protein VGO34_04725 [Alphaproteobacteria bacterium]|jgi:hypothetical protein